jgi:alpha-beta hydrolase superfamily lysophospholipase
MRETAASITYNSHESSWREIDCLLPASLRSDRAPLPRESTWNCNGHSIHLDRLGPNESRCHFIVAHGGGGNGRLMLPLLQNLAAAGFSAVAPDLPPYGLSQCAKGHVLTYSDWVKLLAELIREETTRLGRPVALFGASLGGMLAYNAAAALDIPVRCLIVTTLADPRLAKVRRQVAAHPLFLSLLPVLKFFRWTDQIKIPFSRVARMRSIANDPTLARAIKKNRRAAGTPVSMSFIRTMMDSDPATEPEGFTRCPVLLAHPGEDHMTPLSPSLPFFERLAAPKRLVMLDGAGHYPVEEPGRSQLRDAIEGFLGEFSSE